jgi:tetratricopeptide (TPR) repeat protein
VIAFLSLLALAEEPLVPPPVDAPVVDVHPTDALPVEVPSVDPIVPMSGAELVDEAWRRIDLHDFEGARIVAEQARDRNDDARTRAIVALGAAWELDGEPAKALALYEEARAAGLEGKLADDVIFRVAECHAALGHYPEAFAELDQLGDPELRPYLDNKKIHLARGTWQMWNGQREDGQEELAAALSGIGSDEVTWYQARARAAVATDLCDQANAIVFPAKDKKLVKALRARTGLILDAEAQVVAALELKEPEWGLQGLLVLGIAYERVADDLLYHPIPKQLKTDEQRAMYEAAVREKVDVLFVKASRYFGDGLDAATRLGWDSPRVDALEQARASVLAKIAPTQMSPP